MFTAELLRSATAVLTDCRSKGLRLATAESCTGGLIAALLTEISGSSSVFERGFVTYSNSSKTQLLGVEEARIAEHGAVSEAVAVAMATGARERANVDIAVAVTGVAGPDGGTPEKPVGTVCIAVAAGHHVSVETHRVSGNRSEIRLASVEKALAMLAASLTRSFVSVV
jgi:nicotinamide-nucleotide amidase